MLYLNKDLTLEEAKDLDNLTLTSVVFELSIIDIPLLSSDNLTLTSVVFELINQYCQYYFL